MLACFFFVFFKRSHCFLNVSNKMCYCTEEMDSVLDLLLFSVCYRECVFKLNLLDCILTAFLGSSLCGPNKVSGLIPGNIALHAKQLINPLLVG